jgi:hypothetical protein
VSYQCPKCQHAIEDAMPKSRFDEVNRELGESKKLAGAAEQLGAKVRTLEQQLATKDAHYAREAAMLAAGLTDPSVREVFGMYFDRQASAEGGEKDAAKWLASLQADPAKAPGVLSALLPSSGKGGSVASGGAAKGDVAAAGGQSAPANPAKGAWVPPAPAGGKGAPAGAPAYTAEQVNSMSLPEFMQNYSAIIQSNPELARQFSPALPFGGGSAAGAAGAGTGGSGKGA